MRYYIALAHSVPDRGFSVTFPDFPGWSANVRSFYDVRAVAAKGLASHIEELESCGEAIPQPSSFADLMENPRNHACETLLVGAPPIGGRRVAATDLYRLFCGNPIDEWPEASA